MESSLPTMPPKPPPVPPTCKTSEGGTSASDVTSAAAQKAMEKKMKQRLYIRKMMRIYRDEHRQSREYLTNRIAELKTHLDHLIHMHARKRESATLLPWSDVAQALRENAAASMTEHHALQAEVAVYHGLVENVWLWMASCDHVSRALNPNQPSWRHVTLLADPRARRLGKEWITQQLYHNTNRILQQHLPRSLSPEDDYASVDVTFSGEFIHTTLCRQVVMTASRDEVVDLYRSHLIGVVMADLVTSAHVQTLSETTHNTVLHKRVTASGEYLGFLGGEFHEPNDRSIFVVQQIVDDEAHVHSLRQRNRMYWVDVRSWGDKAIVQYVAVSTQCFMGGRYFSLDEEAVHLGLDLSQCPEEMKETKMERHIQHLLRRKRMVCQRHVGEILHKA
ncbi:Aste57867_24245 [Aphanomyces stellatus]|uniref:Aste57867_24245 protein n=1 Tax=Aphanomyces stellatus TaxID=120398 RepID=A0A485LPX5_9STRA|nr:hypothetical protein As57867_024170 [Aphanomyces stellatus]VFU00885.1 Aste57867_24245 [Aphanomyces stellatus]